MSDGIEDRDDELLSAYIDGELPRAEADELERRLGREPALTARLEALRAMDRATAAAFHAVDEQPLPARVLELLGEVEEEPRASNVVPLRRAGGPREFFRLPVALAASIALVAGLWLGGLLDESGAPDGAAYASRIAEGSALYAAFEQTASGDTIELGGDRYAEPVLTFLSDGGAWCRQVRITGGPSQGDTLACRRDGEWQVELVAFGPPAAAPGDGAYGQASAGGTPAVRAALQALAGREPPLGPAAEAEVIGRGWENGASRNGSRE